MSLLNGPPTHKPMTGIINAVLIVGIAVLIFTYILYVIGKQTEKAKLLPEGNRVCKITLPWVMLNEGWKVEAPEDDGFLNELARTGKVTKTTIPNLVSCTTYRENMTPVTVLSELAMYKLQ